MTSPDGTRNANVVLTADASQYQQQMQQSTQSTNRLNAAVHTLATSLDGITKRAGRKLIQFSAGDFAALAGATATAATFEKQLSTLRAGADVTKTSFRGLKAGIEDTFTSMPVSRAQVIALTEALSNMGVTGVRNITLLTQTFTKLGAATGEGTVELAQNLTQLSRLMGVTNAQQIGNYANALLTVSKNAGVSATGVLSFAQAIAPLARQAGVGESAILGISTAFSKAGADGFVAANTFNSLVSQITNLTQTGSPELQKYANLIGKTQQQFAKMDKTTALTDIFEAIARQGPRAIQTLNQLGIDGIRAQSAISAVVQTGNLRESIATATGADGNQKNLNRASKDAMSGLSDELIKLRNNFTQLGTELGTTFLTPLEKVLGVFNKVFSVMNAVIKPFAPIISAVGALAGAFTAMGGAALLAVGIVGKLALLRTALTFSGLAALRQGITAGRNPAAVTDAGRLAAAGGLRWYQRGFFNVGAGVGRVIGPSDPNAPVGVVGRAASAAARLPFAATSYLANTQTRFLQDSTQPPFERAGQTVPPVAGTPGAVYANVRQRARRAFQAGQGLGAQTDAAGRGFTVAPDGTTTRTAGSAAQAEHAMRGFTVAADGAAARTTAASVQTAASQRTVGAAARAAAGDLIVFGRQTLATGATFAGRGAAMAGGALARGAGSLLSSPLGILGLSFGLPYALSQLAGKKPDYSVPGAGNDVNNYDQKLGKTSTNLAMFSTAVSAATSRLNGLAGQNYTKALKITPSDIATGSAGYKVVDSSFKILSKSMDKNPKASTTAAVSYIQSLAAQHGGLDAQYLQSIKEDLIATYGPGPAQQILNQYNRTAGAGSGAPRINYGALTRIGSKLSGKDYSDLTDQVFTTAQSQAQLSPGQRSSTAELRAVLGYSGTLVGAGGSGTNSGTGRRDQLKSFGGNLHRLFGTDKDALGLSQQPLRNEKEAQAFILEQIVTTPQGRTFLKSLGVNLKETTPFSLKNPLAQGMSILSQIPKSTGFGTALGTGGQENNALRGSALGQFVLGNAAIQKTIGIGPNIGNPQAQLRTQDALVAQAIKITGSLGGASDALQNLSQKVLNTDTALSGLAAAAMAQVRATQSTVLPTLGRGAQTRQLYSNLQNSYKNRATDPTTYGNDLNAYRQQMESNRQYAASLYTTVRDYNVQTERAYEDYHKQVFRQTRDFNIQMQHSERDFQKQRVRMQRDFNIQMEQQALQSAQSIYNPFTRVFDQQTADAGTVLQNLGDQNDRIQKQYAQLRKLRKMGVSQQTIDVLNLADPANAQQLDNMVQGITNNPDLIKKINAAVNKRQKATTQLTQSDYNATFRQTVDSFHRSFEDMTRDFNTSRNDAQEAEHRGLTDMATDFSQMMDRSAADLTRALTEVTGTFEDLMKKTFKELGKTIGKEAPEYAAVIQNAMDSINIPGANSGDTGSRAAGGGGAAKLGSAKNPISTSGTLGVAPNGQIGTYDSAGHFKVQDTRGLPPSYLKNLPHISNPKYAADAQTPQGAKKYAAQQFAKYGWSQSQMAALNQLWNNESGWRYTAYNSGSGAVGIPQLLPQDYRGHHNSQGHVIPPGYLQSGAVQIDWGLNYIAQRYGSPNAARDFEFSHDPHWYDHGGVLKPGVTKTVNMTGSNEYILTPKQLQAVHTAGLGTPVTNTYKIYNDNSMLFRDITVMASDPNLMAKQLAQKARVARLSHPPRSTATA